MQRNAGSFRCDHEGCGATFTREWRLLEHRTAHTGEKLYGCDVGECGRRFTRKAHLKRHMLSHSGVKNFKCSYVGCSESFITPDSLKRHVKYTHGEKDSYFKCFYQGCGKSFKKRKTFKSHLNEHVSAPLFRCQKEKCRQKFETAALRKAHEKTHKGYACKVAECPVVAANWTKLQKHRLLHPVEYRCQQCQKTFKKCATLRNHKRSHALQKPVLLCPIKDCKIYFTTTFNLQHHIRKEHLQLFKYSCYYPDCAKVFAMRESLLRHLVSHDPDRKLVKVKQKRPDKSWQKRLGGSSSQKAPVIEEDLRALFEQKLHFRIHSKVECNLSGLFNERKIPRIIEQEVGLRELFEPPLLKLPKVA
ncbi:P43 5S RNA-binding protein [Polypterus senegalus]|uniref:P43 5S RNA-binding protein n=1 Tax=Polypterus senegalus TaxID=55291 RepID=UPI001963A5B3|nr:P43 5S RNA-binding protein [Polypterus senegalus]